MEYRFSGLKTGREGMLWLVKKEPMRKIGRMSGWDSVMATVDQEANTTTTQTETVCIGTLRASRHGWTTA